MADGVDWGISAAASVGIATDDVVSLATDRAVAVIAVLTGVYVAVILDDVGVTVTLPPALHAKAVSTSIGSTSVARLKL